MRRLLVPTLIGCLLIVGSGTAHARYGGGQPPPPGVIDTWLVRGDHVVGRSQIAVSPPPTLTMSMRFGHSRVLAWRVMNVEHAQTIMMDTVCESSRPGIRLRYLTPKGEDVSSDVSRPGYTQTHVEAGTFRTLYVHVDALRPDAGLSCVLRGYDDGGFDKVLLNVTS